MLYSKDFTILRETPECDDTWLDRQTGPHVQVVTLAFIALTFLRCRFRPCASARKTILHWRQSCSPKALNDRKCVILSSEPDNMEACERSISLPQRGFSGTTDSRHNSGKVAKDCESHGGDARCARRSHHADSGRAHTRLCLEQHGRKSLSSRRLRALLGLWPLL